MMLTCPIFCSTTDESVYFTARACEIEFGATSAEWGRLVLYSTRPFSITICASVSEQKISAFKHSSHTSH